MTLSSDFHISRILHPYCTRFRRISDPRSSLPGLETQSFRVLRCTRLCCFCTLKMIAASHCCREIIGNKLWENTILRKIRTGITRQYDYMWGCSLEFLDLYGWMAERVCRYGLIGAVGQLGGSQTWRSFWNKHKTVSGFLGMNTFHIEVVVQTNT